MIQGRIVSINGLPFAKWRQQLRNGDERGLWRTEFNFSSREQLDTSETVVAGPPMSPFPGQLSQSSRLRSRWSRSSVRAFRSA